MASSLSLSPSLSPSQRLANRRNSSYQSRFIPKAKDYSFLSHLQSISVSPSSTNQSVYTEALRSELIGNDLSARKNVLHFSSKGPPSLSSSLSSLSSFSPPSPSSSSSSSSSSSRRRRELSRNGVSSLPSLSSFHREEQEQRGERRERRGEGEREREIIEEKGPFNQRTKKLLMKERGERERKIPLSPFKVIDAPRIQDDFYLHLLDWSEKDIIAVGLEYGVYCWNKRTGMTTRVHGGQHLNDVTSVKWAKNDQLIVGTRRGKIVLWDVKTQKQIVTYSGHSSRVGVMAVSRSLITSGSRDRNIISRDIRVRPESSELSRLSAHRQEVCGLQWSPDERYLASGGNDNILNVWDISSSSLPLCKFTDHNAAIKGLCWSPHQRGLLVSGGGTADRTIRFWNTLENKCLKSYDTGSQVCNLAWSSSSNEIVSTHGYSQNQITVWSLPRMEPIATLLGHSSRVLYLAQGPDGQSIVTGAGDETLRFWKVFPPKESLQRSMDKPTRYQTIR